MQAYCIADEDTARGFRLAGVPGQAVSTPEEAFARTVERPDCGLLIVTADVLARLGPQLAALRVERSRPLVVELPGPGALAPGAQRESLRQRVQKIVGTSLEEEA